MTGAGVLAIGLAAVAMYGIGLPLAWLLPAPRESEWVYRVAIAPVLAVALVGPLAWLLTAVGIPLHPVQLIVLLCVLWAIAWRRTGALWRFEQALRQAGGPAIIVSAAAITWVASLRGYGLYLPNRDFKNHAYIVAQVAFSSGADPAELLRASPVAERLEGGFYPHGLHTLLGWALPSPDFNSLGVTAAAAVLTAVISLPLAFIALARMLRPDDQSLTWVVGSLAVLLPGLTSSFGIGSVVLIAGTALYSAGLVTLWLFLREPSRATAISLAGVLLGLLLLHVAEAIGLALVAGGAVLVLSRAGPLSRMSRRELVIAGAVGAGVALASLAVFLRLGLTRLLERPVDSWDVEPNDFTVVTAPLGAFWALVGGSVPAFLALLVCVLGGAVMAARENERYVLVAIVVPLALALVAGAAVVPDWLRVITAPWYGSVSRISMMLGAPAALASGLVLVRIWSHARRLGVRGGPAVALPALALACAVLVAITAVGGIVEARRLALWASLAGAGDTPLVARDLVALLEPGQVVLNFEGDGTANLFAAARVPVVSALRTPEEIGVSGLDTDELLSSLMRLSDPAVSEMMSAAGVGYIAIGTTSMYRGSDGGYSIDRLLRQGQLTLAVVGSDITVLAYEPSSS